MLMNLLTKNKIKYIQSLYQKKQRELHQQFVIEGEKMIVEAIEAIPDKFDSLYVTSAFHHPIPNNIQAILLKEDELKRISSLTTPNKALAVVNMWNVEAKESHVTLVLDKVQDPGNLGTIIRLADWFGVSKLVCSNDTVDFRNPKVLQATMGSVFRVQVEYCDLHNFLSTTDLPIYGALLEGENVYQMQLSQKAILIMGNEGNGISEDVKSLIKYPIHIPRIGEAESLNVSTATAILLSEFSRLRLK